MVLPKTRPYPDALFSTAADIDALLPFSPTFLFSLV